MFDIGGPAAQAGRRFCRFRTSAPLWPLKGKRRGGYPLWKEKNARAGDALTRPRFETGF